MSFLYASCSANFHRRFAYAERGRLRPTVDTVTRERCDRSGFLLKSRELFPEGAIGLWITEHAAVELAGRDSRRGRLAEVLDCERYWPA